MGAHCTGLPPPQLPDEQVEPTVQALPSSQGAPSDAAGFEQAPVPGSHCPARWHASEATQTVLVPPPQFPRVQVSPVVQALLSSQRVPSGAGGLEQVPVAGLQLPATWHASVAGHVTGAPPHTPPWQLSCTVQRFPSSQPVPSGSGAAAQAPVLGSQNPAPWQESDAGHCICVPD
jgi:hypothetical protein